MFPGIELGHLVVNGAGGVRKVKTINGQDKVLQRFISILIPTALHLGPDEGLYMESEDFASVFNFFRVPDAWSPYFAYFRKVSGAAFGHPERGQVRPALRVIPMGWKSAVTIVQAAVRHIVFQLTKVPQSTSVEKGQPIPEGKHYTVVYLDNFDEIRVYRKMAEDFNSDASEPTETHKRFNEVCDELGLPRNQSKQLIGAMAGGIQDNPRW